MTKNDILRRLRYALNITDAKVAELISLTGRATKAEEPIAWMKREDEKGYTELSDPLFCRFMDGLIIDERGPHPSGKSPEPLEFISNNEVLKKLRIALELQAEDMIEVFNQVEFTVTKSELSAFYRRHDHRNFRKCPDQVLKKFIKGLSTKEEKAD